FVPVRVDTLRRPDIYARYGLDGWPTVAFVLPDGNPFYYVGKDGRITRAGGTYYTPEGFDAYLNEMADYYAANKEKAAPAAEEISRAILSRKEVGSAPVTPEALEVSVTKFLEAYASLEPNPAARIARHPDPDSVELALQYFALKKNRSVLDAALRLVTDMARGGIRDHLGGGFHRYATDGAWRVPAFEKMLITNAELLQTYMDVFALTRNGQYLAIADGVADYMMTGLAAPEGWFHAYQAADAKLGEDGDYYTWTLAEAQAVLSEDERAIILPAFEIAEWGDLSLTAPRRNVLYLIEGPTLLSARLGIELSRVTATFEAGKKKLLEARSRRTAPPLGRLLLTDANAAAASALIRAGGTRRNAAWREAGLRALEIVYEKTRNPQTGLHAHFSDPAGAPAPHLFADQAQMVRALLDAYESTGESRHLDRALSLAQASAEAFKDSLNGGFMDRVYEADAPGLLSWPTRSLRDNALFCLALVRLHHLTGEPADGPLFRMARKALESWADEFAGYGQAGSLFGLAAHRLLSPPLELIVLGPASEEGRKRLFENVRALYAPWKVTRHPGTQDAAALLAARGLDTPAGAGVVLCLGERCSGPLDHQANLHQAAEALAAPPAEDPK
ncbi:MAG TPA: hypothetical protein VFP98_08110, partial [Candidatus Polarisedimenticolia bacterium]|nr:hypothetical protein [Candidatus Polarisedimenticolia bacterium]